jgi:hypothetical protein
MATQRIIWTVLPNGIDGATRKLSVLVSPRLEVPAPTTLDAFADLRDWPTRALTFTLKFESVPPGQTKEVTVAAPPAPPERSKLWAAAFPKETGVEGHSPTDYSTLIVNSFPMANVLSFITGQYQKFASSPLTATHFPAVAQLVGQDGLGPIGFGWHVAGTPPTSRPLDGPPPVAAELRKILDGKKHKAVPPGPPNPSLDFWQLKEIVRPRNATKQLALSGGFKTTEYVPFFPKQLDPPAFDFHKGIALLGEHPRLLRALGLIVDLELTEPVPASGFVWVENVESSPDWDIDPVDVRPKTRYGQDFRAQAKTGDLKDGFLALGSGFDLIEVDVEGAGLKLMNLANTALASLYAARKTADTPRRFSLPALRSGGLSLVRSGRATELVERLARSAKLNADAVKQAGPVQSELHAEDLVRGYAIDVKDEAGTSWQSLCRRRISYVLGKGAAKASLPAGANDKLDDEGWTTLATTSGPDRQKEPDLTLTEAILRWDGWSLTTRRPGKQIGTDDKPADFDNAPDKLQVVIGADVAPGSLPRLRFGHQYSLRARAVDVAGNSLPHTFTGAAPALGPRAYSRFEPVPHPVVVPKTKAGPGESLERLVIRSFNDDPSKDGVASSDENARHVAPPLGSQLLAEWHGKFDSMSPAASYSLVQSKQGTYEDPADPSAGEVPHPEAQLALPYLPDPLTRGVAFLGLPLDEIERFLGLPGAPLNKETEHHADGTKTVTDLSASEKPPITLIKVDFGPSEKWPELQPFSLRIREGANEPEWDKDARVLSVFVPKAETAKVRVSSYVGEDAFALLGIWRWIEEKKPALSAAVLKRLRQLGMQGRHWMLTPFRDLVLVHAVQQPMLTPNISALSVTREIGSTAARLHDAVDVHAKSTIKLDLNAEWSEPVDVVADEGPGSISGARHAFEVPIAYPPLPEQPSGNVASIDHLHELGDTKHRLVRYRATATTRYREYFDDDSLVFTRKSEEVSLQVPSSARPEAPRILYVVPTFGWERTPEPASERRSTRVGGGLRVYLERPWYSSGDDERLGVVLPQPSLRRAQTRTRGRRLPAQVVPDELKPYVTQWGGDPIAASPVAKALLAPADFPLATEKRSKLTLAELEGSEFTVAVAAHEPEYDKRRRLWYCDIELNAGPAYFPFVRLALARYQPYSVEIPAKTGQPLQNVHLSRVVLADFVQLAPDRSATIAFESETKLTVSVVGVGVQFNAVDVRVETLRTDVPTDLGWITAPGATVDPLISASPKAPKRFAVSLPAPAGGPMPLRLVIREFEVLPTSFDGKQEAERLVYAEVFPL